MRSQSHKDTGAPSIARECEILLAVDDPHTLRTMDWALSGKGYQVTTTSSGLGAVDLLDVKSFDLLIVALQRGVSDGIAALAKAREKNPLVRNIVLADDSDVADAFDVLRFMDVDDCIWKPCSLSELLDRVSTCLKRWQGDQVGLRSESRFQEINKETLQFLTLMTHDIRGSLVAIGAGLKLLNRGLYGTMEESAAGKVNDLYERVRNLVGMAEEFLGKVFSLTEDFEIKEETVYLKEDVVRPILDELSSEMRDYGILLDNHLDSVSFDRIAVQADTIWLKAVFRNLFKNAIKYGGPGCSIAVGFEDRGGSHYRLNVRNSGMPVPEDKRGKLFTRFGRLSNGDKGSDSGVGLGLFMIKEIVRRHGGDIWYEAGENSSNFIFTLPRK